MASSFRKHGSTFTSYSFRSSGLVERVEILTSNTLTRFYVIAMERTLPMVKVKWIMYILKYTYTCATIARSINLRPRKRKGKRDTTI